MVWCKKHGTDGRRNPSVGARHRVSPFSQPSSSCGPACSSCKTGVLALLQLLVGRARLAHATARPVRDVARLGRGTDVVSRFPATGQTAVPRFQAVGPYRCHAFQLATALTRFRGAGPSWCCTSDLWERGGSAHPCCKNDPAGGVPTSSLQDGYICANPSHTGI